MPYDKQSWTNEAPYSTPVKYSIEGDAEGVISESAEIQVVTPVTAGSPFNAERMNHMEDGIETAQETAELALETAENAVGVIARILSAQSIAPSSSVPLSFLNTQVVTDGIWTIANPTRLYIPHSGLYLLKIEVGWSGHATGTRTIKIWMDGAAGEEYGEQVTPPSASPFYQSVTTVLYLSGTPAGRYIHIDLTQNSGTTLTATAIVRMASLGKVG